MNTTTLTKLQHSLHLTFHHSDNLVQALTHRSFLNENRNHGLPSNERMEFLGDSILSFLVSREIYRRYPDYPEGKLTFIRTHLVRTETLADLAAQLGLGEYLLLSRGEEQEKGRTNPLLLANCFEAVIGAIYLDQGLDILQDFFNRIFSPLLSDITDAEIFKDSKSLLQEKLQTKGGQPPSYRLHTHQGPDHNRVFTMGVYFEDSLLAEGIGKSKQEAEEMAAQKALEIVAKNK